jgi:hypothetical protein
MRPSDVVKSVVRADIAGERISLPSPPAEAGHGAQIYHIRIDDEKDGDVAEWLRVIRRGQVSNVLRILIRRALELPDISRYFMGGRKDLIVYQATGPPQPQKQPLPKQQRTERGNQPQAGKTTGTDGQPHGAGNDNSAAAETGAVKQEATGEIDPLSII